MNRNICTRTIVNNHMYINILWFGFILWKFVSKINVGSFIFVFNVIISQIIYTQKMHTWLSWQGEYSKNKIKTFLLHWKILNKTSCTGITANKYFYSPLIIKLEKSTFFTLSNASSIWTLRSLSLISKKCNVRRLSFVGISGGGTEGLNATVWGSYSFKSSTLVLKKTTR